ncbi:MAG: type II toxin-antitoxin system Phd/YefM family antitoxin [Janthinobacterium lividum]
MHNQDKPPAHLRIGVREFRGNMTGFLRQARNGASFLITSHDEVVAELHPPSIQAQPQRQPGGLQMWMAPGFDDLPDDVLAEMEGGL